MRPRTLVPLALALAGAGCGGEPAPVARLSLAAGPPRGAAPGELTLGYPEVRRATLVWEPLAALPADGEGRPLVFVHLVDGAGTVLRTFDHPFPAAWRPGERIEDQVELYQSTLAPPLPAGRYRLTVGLYRPGAERYALAAPGEELGRREYAVAAVTVVEEDPGLPRIEPAGDWLPVEPGADRQVLAVRWLSGEGELWVHGAPAAGSLWLRLRIPSPNLAGHRVVYAGEGREQEVRLATPCGGAESLVTGAGAHELEIRIDPGEREEASLEVAGDDGGEAAGDEAGAPAAGVDGDSEAPAGSCPVRLAASYHLVDEAGGPERRAVLVETVAWRRR